MNRSWPVKGILPISLMALWSCTDTASLLTPEARPQASHLTPDCFGRNATIYIGSPGAGTITPDGSGGYTITGTSGDDVIVGGSGNDVINGSDGTDRICGGDGDDVLSGGNGTNYVDGGLGNDVVDYSAASGGVSANLVTGKGRGATIIDAALVAIENIVGSAFDDLLRGDAASNSIRGGDGNDVLYGFEATDSLFGQSGNDVLHGDDGADVLSGGTGDDEIMPGPGADWIVGQGGVDVVNYTGSTAIDVNLATNTGTNGDAAGDTWRGIETFIGTSGNDTFTGDDENNEFDGRGGDDLINGGGGRDRLIGGPGADEIHGGDDADHIFGKEDNDDLYGDDGDDVFLPGEGLNTLDGGNGTDRIVSGNCLDAVTSIEVMQSGACDVDSGNTTVTAAASSIVADGASSTTITVQLKDAGGNNFTVGGKTVVLTTDAGTLSNGGAPAASVTATDQNDGTYTAALISSTSLATATVTATVDGNPIADDAAVTFTFGPLDHFLVEAAGGGTIPTQVKNAPFDIDVTAQDANNHTVTDFTATVALDYEGDVSGSITAASTAFTAGVLSSESVSIPAIGASVQIRATDDADAHTGVSVAFTVDPSDEAPQVTSTTPLDAATGIAAGATITIGFSENVDVTAASFDLECPATTDHAFTLSGSNASYTLTPNSALPGVTTCTVTVIAANVNDSDTDDAPDNMAADYVFSFTTAPVATPDTYGETVLGNVSVNSANAATSFSVLANDEIDGGTTITSVGWTGTPGVTENGGSVTVTPGGTFTYNPPAGYEGTDRFTYTITGGSSADVTLTVSGMLWFVNNAGAACTSVAAGCGRLSNPLSSLAAFNTENTGVGNRPAGGDGIFLYESASAYPGALTLLANQKLIGQDATASLATLGYTVAPSSAALPAMDSGNGTKVTISGADGINLGSGNTLRGFTVATTAGEAIGGSGFGTLTLSGGVADVTIASSGQALGLTTGTITGTFASVGSTGGTNNVAFDGVSASALTLGTGTLSGSTGGAIKVVGGNPLNLTVAGAVTQAANAALLDVSGSHAGTLNFTNTSNLQASSGTGLQFNAAGGTYTFSGTTNLAGGDAGVDITNGSAGSFTFGTGTTITNPSGVGFRLYGSTASVTYSGGMTKSSAGNIIEIGEHSAGTATFNTGTISATGGSGVSFSNADGTYNFNGTTTLNGGDAHVHIASGSAGAITFGTGAAVTNPSTTAALAILNGVSATNVTFNGALATNAARPVNIEGVSSGTVTIGGTINTTAGSGMLIQNNTGGSITLSNATKTLSTGANAAVTLANNTGATVTFSNGGLALTTTSGNTFTATGGGTVNVTGANNTVNATAGGTAVNIQNTTIGGSGVTFYSVNATGSGTNGIVLSNTGGAFVVTGDGASDVNNTTRGRTTAKSGGGSVNITSGGTISGRSGNGVTLTTTGSVILRNMFIQGSGSSGDGINATTVSGLTLDNVRITAHASDHGLLGSAVSGLTIDHSEIDNNGTTAGVVEGPDIWNVRLLGVTGTSNVRNSNIHHSQEDVFGIINTSGTLTLTVSNTNISDTGTGAGGSIAFFVAANGSSNITLNMQNDSVNRGRARGIQVSTETAASATVNMTVSSSQFHNNGIAVEAAHGSGGTFTYNIANNNMQTGQGVGVGSFQAINVNRLGSPSFNSFGLFTGTISGNTIGTAGTLNSGSDTGSGIEVESNGSGGTMRTAIVSNTIREVATHGIYVAAVDANIGGTAPPLFEARIAGNNISNMDAVGLDGIHVLPGALSTDDLTMCIDIANNTSNAPRNGLRVRPSGLPAAPSTVQLEGWDGVTAVNTYFTNRPNTLTGGIAAISTTAPPAPGGFFAVANCNTP